MTTPRYVIHRYVMDRRVLSIELPVDSRVLHFDRKPGDIYPSLWIIKNEAPGPTRTLTFRAFNTGETLPEGLSPSHHIGTFIECLDTLGAPLDVFVNHVFDITHLPET